MECGESRGERCVGCKADVPDTAKFCPECGTPVTAAPAPRDLAPQHLVDRILTDKASVEGELKLVSVLFADVKGSMDLQEGLDPEDWARVTERFFQILADGVHRFEGCVNQYTGDGVMALFGAPIAHEDHAQRACFAALQLRDDLQGYARELKRDKGLQFSTRIGINSGDVVVGKVGDDLRMDYTAQGHSVGLAARMENLASPDTIYVTQNVADLCEGYFELDDLGAFNVKGVSEPVGVHQLQGIGKLKTRFDVSRARGLSRFVGRTDEVATLTAALESARHGEGQVVGIVAHAGVGKSRLCFEFLERCRSQGLFVTEGQAVPHGKNIPLLPVMQAFRAYYGVSESDDARTTRDKIAGRMLLIDESFRDVLPLLFDFFGAPDPERPAPKLDPDARRRQLLGILRRTVQADSSEDVGITLLEDLHWFDEGSEAFLREWVEALSGTRTLLILNFRPEYRAEWMSTSHYRQIPLQPLGPGAIRELLGDLLGNDPSIEGLADTIHERTQGNPFFTEEVVRTLIEDAHLEGARGAYRLVTPVRDLQVPNSVHAVLAARIDRLAEREKQLLQTAAVIGKTFEEPVLQAVADLPLVDFGDAIAVLKSGEFVHEDSLYPVVEYAFRHPLTQEVALGSQLAERRRRLHAVVAGAIQELKPEHLDEQAALIAHHWEEAGEPLESARWYARAAERAASRDPAEGVRLWRKSLELAREAPPTKETVGLRKDAVREILFGGAWRIGMAMEDVDALYVEGKELGQTDGDRHYLAELEVGYLPSVGLLAGDIVAYAEGSLRALPLIQEVGDAELLMVNHVTLSYSHWLKGDAEAALRYARGCLALGEQDLEAGRKSVGFSGYVWALQQCAALSGWCGDVQGALRGLERAIRVARDQEETEVLGWALNDLVEITTVLSGELGDAPAWGRESIDSAQRLGSYLSEVHSLARGMGLVQIFRGEWDAAVDSLERALEVARERRTGIEQEPIIMGHLAHAHVGRGDLERGLEIAEAALALSGERGCGWGELEAHMVRARAWLGAGETSRADTIAETLDRLDALVVAGGMRAFEPQVLELRGELAGLRGDEAGHLRLQREAHARYEKIGATGHARRLADLLGDA